MEKEQAIRDLEAMKARARHEDQLISTGVKPNFMVVSERVGTPCLTIDNAVYWQSLLMQNGVETSIIDLRGYDWDKNPWNLMSHDRSTDEGKASLFNVLNPNQVVH